MGARARFTQADLKRAVSGVVAAGVLVGRIEIDPSGKIVILPANSNDKAEDGEWADLE